MIKFLYKHKSKLIIVIFFIVGTFVGNSINISKLYYGYDKSRYDEACRLLKKNEKEAVEILEHINFDETEYSINEVTNGRELWRENIKIADNVSIIENASWEIKKTSIKVKDYCILRLSQCFFLVKKIKGDSTFLIDKKLKNVELKIDEFIEKNSTLPIFK